MLNIRDYINDIPWFYILTIVCIDKCGIRAIGAASATTTAAAITTTGTAALVATKATTVYP